MTDHDPFVVCSRCLFESALSIPFGQASGAVPSAGPPLSEPGEPGNWLSVRADFTDRYEVQGRRAQGGQGEILEVWDLRLRRTLAMKRLNDTRTGDPAVLARFLAEAQITGQLQHPGILPIHDVGIDPDGRPFYTTDLLPGTTLADLFVEARRTGRLERALASILEPLVRVCEIVAHAHARGVIHRDLKPGNVLVGAFGDVRVIDWGSAFVSEVPFGTTPFVPGEVDTAEGRAEAQPDSTSVRTDRSDLVRRDPGSSLSTSASGQPLTILYAPPEALNDAGTPPGPAADVYAMGVMLYEVCTGRKPYADVGGKLPEPDELKRRIPREDPVPVRRIQRRVPRDLAAICAKAMHRDLRRRYADMQALASDLRAFLEVRPVAARPLGIPGTIHKWLRRHALAVAAGSVALALIGVATAVAVRVDAERRRIDTERRRVDGERLAAVQLKALRESDLAAREGRWRESLDRLRLAEEAGYPDRFDLALRRYTAWIVLWEPDRAREELDALDAGAGDDAGRRALAMLRRGEFELFDSETYEDGVRRVREALELGLDPAESAFARGALAEGTLEALEHFRACLAIQPYHHAAHRHSLGLELLTGQHEALAAHANVFRGLFPDDPSPAMATAMAAAVRGDLAGAEEVVESYRATLGEGAAGGLRSILEASSIALSLFDVDLVLGDRPRPEVDLDSLQKRLMSLVLGGASGTASKDPRVGRMPNLPCVKVGLQKCNAALLSMVFQPAGEPDEVAARIARAWEGHREGLVPFGAAFILESQHSSNGPARSDLVPAQARLFDLATKSFSVVPGIPRLARYRAAKAHSDLVRGGSTNHVGACLEHLRLAAASPVASPGELREYSRMALELRDFPLAEEFVARWERIDPSNSVLRRRRIELQVGHGTLGPALRNLERLLAESPDDAWARSRRDAVRRELRRLADALPPDGSGTESDFILDSNSRTP